MTNLTHKGVLDRMHALMDGNEWNAADLCDRLAEMMTTHLGYVIREPGAYDPPNLPSSDTRGVVVFSETQPEDGAGSPFVTPRSIVHLDQALQRTITLYHWQLTEDEARGRNGMTPRVIEMDVNAWLKGFADEEIVGYDPMGDSVVQWDAEDGGDAYAPGENPEQFGFDNIEPVEMARLLRCGWTDGFKE